MKPKPLRLLMCAGSVALAIGLLTLALGMVQGAGNLTRVTTASSSDRASGFPSINANGTKIAFMSDSDFLRQGIPNLQVEIWLYNTETMTFTRVTTKAGSGIRYSALPSLSANGTKIAFQSDSDFLGQGIQSRKHEVWLYDTTTMTFTRVTTSPPDSQWEDILAPQISADGTKVVFQSDSDFFGQGIQQDQEEIWLYDTQTMTFTRLTTASHSNRRSLYPELSANGTKVAFMSDSDFLGQGIPDEQYEVWLYDTATMTLTRITTASDSNRDSWVSTSLNADGTKIAFRSDSDFLGQGIPDDQNEIWLCDTATMTLARITTASHNNRDSYGKLSADGKKIAFVSDSDFLGQGIPDNQDEIWLYDTSVMTLTRITTASPSLRQSSRPSLSADGTKIAFDSEADFLSQGILTDQLEIWLYSQSQSGGGHKTYLPIVLKQSP